MGIYQVNMKFKETTAGLLQVQADDEDQAYQIAVKVIEAEGGTDIEFLGCELVRTDEEHTDYRNSLN